MLEIMLIGKLVLKPYRVNINTTSKEFAFIKSTFSKRKLEKNLGLKRRVNKAKLTENPTGTVANVLYYFILGKGQRGLSQKKSKVYPSLPSLLTKAFKTFIKMDGLYLLTFLSCVQLTIFLKYFECWHFKEINLFRYYHSNRIRVLWLLRKTLRLFVDILNVGFKALLETFILLIRLKNENFVYISPPTLVESSSKQAWDTGCSSLSFT